MIEVVIPHFFTRLKPLFGLYAHEELENYIFITKDSVFNTDTRYCYMTKTKNELGGLENIKLPLSDVYFFLKENRRPKKNESLIVRIQGENAKLILNDTESEYFEVEINVNIPNTDNIFNKDTMKFENMSKELLQIRKLHKDVKPTLKVHNNVLSLLLGNYPLYSQDFKSDNREYGLYAETFCMNFNSNKDFEISANEYTIVCKQGDDFYASVIRFL